MQLSLEQKRNMRHYAYVSGFRNVAWLTGYIEEIKENCLYISQNGYRNTAVLVFFDDKTKPRGIKQGSGSEYHLSCSWSKAGFEPITHFKSVGL